MTTEASGWGGARTGREGKKAGGLQKVEKTRTQVLQEGPALLTPGFGPVRLISNVGPPELQHNKRGCLKPPSSQALVIAVVGDGYTPTVFPTPTEGTAAAPIPQAQTWGLSLSPLCLAPHIQSTRKFLQLYLSQPLPNLSRPRTQTKVSSSLTWVTTRASTLVPCFCCAACLSTPPPPHPRVHSQPSTQREPVM